MSTSPLNPTTSGFLKPSYYESSPPTKWPRAVPPNRRQSIIYASGSESGNEGNFDYKSPNFSKDSNFSIFSPHTPHSLSVNNIHMSSTPSPFRIFSSPSISTRALRLSTTENVIGIRLQETPTDAQNNKENPTFQVTRIQPSQAQTNSQASRCLNLGDSPEESDPDKTLPMRYGDSSIPETPSKALLYDMDFLGHNEYDGLLPFPQTSPINDHLIEIARADFSYDHFDQPCCSTFDSALGSSLDSQSLTLPGQIDHFQSDSNLTGDEHVSPETPTSFKKAMAEVLRQGTLKPRQLLEHDENQPSSNVKPTESPLVPLCTSTPMEMIPPKSRIAKNTKELSKIIPIQSDSALSEDGMRPPKKPLRPYSRRWIRIVTGGTKAQKEMVLAAQVLLRKRAADKNMPLYVSPYEGTPCLDF
ncbi:hypothetical protein WR25_20834 [Diploscapter pachys]|uniref:Uncharacterized protein n=1 Tax=Diploscapter pachys TaxID=2018661 RepID=A0A2A2JPF6_9BILA|nr:hypothetical protein WR25_20834 [Diploscapter pachys]